MLQRYLSAVVGLSISPVIAMLDPVIFSATFFTIFVHAGIATSIIWHDLFFESWISMSGLLLITFLSVIIGKSHIIVTSTTLLLFLIYDVSSFLLFQYHDLIGYSSVRRLLLDCVCRYICLLQASYIQTPHV